MAQKVTSTDIKLALKEFHNGKPSYFITECKTCSTYFPDPQGLLKFDGLAITKSYTNGKMDPMDLELAIKDTNRLLNRLQAMQVQEEQDDKS